MYFRSLLFSCIFFVCQCVSYPNREVSDQVLSVKKTEVPISFIDKVNEGHTYKLLPHQIKPIYYLDSHTKQKGLILNHSLGSGKSIIAIAFAELEQKRPIIILAPNYLKSSWMAYLKKYPARNQKRYEFISYEESNNKLTNRNLSETVLIIDEAHRLVNYVQYHNLRETYANMYLNLKTAHKILALTATPIFYEESDLAYLFNLLSPSKSLPLNKEQFRLQYMKIKKTRSFWRGYFAESLVLKYLLIPGAIAFFLESAISTATTLTNLGFSLLFPILKDVFFPLPEYRLREFDAYKLRHLSQKYLSFYRPKKADENSFPRKNIQFKEVPYTREQHEFFYNFMASDLDISGLRLLFSLEHKSDAQVELMSSSIQDKYKNLPGSGREIGNLLFKKDKHMYVFPKKYIEIDKLLRLKREQTVIYSNYKKNGVESLAFFLEMRGHGSIFKRLTPEMTSKEMQDTIGSYNRGETNVLILDPEVIEGVSLNGTRVLHVLEPPLNVTQLDQVIGRTVRYHSHHHLPKQERHVDVYVWMAVLKDSHPLKGGTKERRSDWKKRYSEFNYYSDFGPGRKNLDKNYHLKIMSPDQYARSKMNHLKESIAYFEEITRQFSIDRAYAVP